MCRSCRSRPSGSARARPSRGRRPARCRSRWRRRGRRRRARVHPYRVSSSAIAVRTQFCTATSRSSSRPVGTRYSAVSAIGPTSSPSGVPLLARIMSKWSVPAATPPSRSARPRRPPARMRVPDVGERAIDLDRQVERGPDPEQPHVEVAAVGARRHRVGPAPAVATPTSPRNGATGTGRGLAARPHRQLAVGPPSTVANT